jgi:hypothetical protein
MFAVCSDFLLPFKYPAAASVRRMRRPGARGVPGTLKIISDISRLLSFRCVKPPEAHPAQAE